MKKMLSMLVLALSSCGVLPRSTPAPVADLRAGSVDGDELVVFLPGRWSTLDEFEGEDFFQIASERWPDAQLVAVDLHLGYYRKRLSAKRLHEDIISPARSRGVKRIRVVGVSMGGLGALIHDLEYPDDIDEMYLLSPFVGEEDVIDEIRSAGGVRDWREEPKGERDYSRRLWRSLESKWLQRNDRPKVTLACGTEDRLVESNRLFVADFLSEEQALWQSGGHDWPTWRSLFREMIR